MTTKNDKTTPLPTFLSLYVSGQLGPRVRYPRDTASLAVTQPLPVAR